MLTLYSIGHSRHAADHFVSLLRAAEVTLLVDVRSHPASRWAPQFGKEPLAQLLNAQGIRYEFLGRELGGRPRGAEYYAADGALDCVRRAASAEFQAGIARLQELARSSRTVMLCAEEDPAQCHRRRLITPVLVRAGARVEHLRGDGRVEVDEHLAPAGAQLGLFA
jgi:uncharacterized protein (DUF488 family)